MTMYDRFVINLTFGYLFLVGQYKHDFRIITFLSTTYVCILMAYLVTITIFSSRQQKIKMEQYKDKNNRQFQLATFSELKLLNENMVTLDKNLSKSFHEIIDHQEKLIELQLNSNDNSSVSSLDSEISDCVCECDLDYDNEENTCILLAEPKPKPKDVILIKKEEEEVPTLGKDVEVSLVNKHNKENKENKNIKV